MVDPRHPQPNSQHIDHIVDAAIRRHMITTFGVDPQDGQGMRDFADQQAWMRERYASFERRREQQGRVWAGLIGGSAISFAVWALSQLGIKVPAWMFGGSH